MTTTKTQSNRSTATPDFEAASEQIRETSDRLLATGRKVTVAYLDGVERYVSGVVKVERKLGEQSQFEVLGQLLDTHATITADVVKAGVAATRELINA